MTVSRIWGGRAMEDSPDLEEELSEVAADLVSYKRFEPFLRRLFAHPPGR